MIIDLMQATQDAIFAALTASVDPNIAPVHQHVPQGTEPPFIKLGPIDAENAAGKGEQFETFVVEIQSIYRGAARTKLLAMMHAVRLALDDVEISAPGVRFGTPRFLNATASDAGPDGVTYAGVSNFEVSAEPA